MVAVNPGHLLLTETDLVHLDRLIAFYRTNQAGGCTTSNRIILTQYRLAEAVASETFGDSSCLAERLPDVLTIDELLRRVSAASDRAFTTGLRSAPEASPAGVTWLPVFGNEGTDKIFVVVVGSVHRPGAYHLPKESVVSNALQAAQGRKRLSSWRGSSLSRLDSRRLFESIRFRSQQPLEDLQIPLKDGDWIEIAEIHGE